MSGNDASMSVRLAKSYLDEVTAAAGNFPTQFFSTDLREVSGQFLSRKEALLRNLLSGPMADAMVALEKARESRASEDVLAPVLCLAYTTRALLWYALSCTPLGLRNPFSGEIGSQSEYEQRQSALRNRTADCRKAAELVPSPDTLASLGRAQAAQELFAESHTTFQQIIDMDPTSDDAIEAMKAQQRLVEVRRSLEARQAKQKARATGETGPSRTTGGGCSLVPLVLLAAASGVLGCWTATLP